MMRRAAICVAALCFATSLQGGVARVGFADPTTRYDHGILGDAIEHGSLDIVTDRGKVLTLRLPETRVFEDIAPRLADVDLDGDNEIIVVETSIELGARLSIYDETGLIAATPYIGRTHRWLAPIGAADFDGDGLVEIAYIDRPHLAKTLRIWRFQDGALVHVVDQAGLTNHRIGDTVIFGGVRTCGSRPEMISVNAGWSKVMASTLENDRVVVRELGPYGGATSGQNALSCK